MMRKLLKLWCLCLTLTLWSGITMAQHEAQEPVKGLLRVKLQSELPDAGRGITTRGGIVRTGREKLDVMNSRLKVTSLKRMFPYSAKYEERMKKHGLHLWYEIRYDEDLDPETAAQAYRSIEGVQAVDAVHPMVLMDGSRSIGTDFTAADLPATRALSAFNDPMLKSQWHYHNDGSLAGSVAGSDLNLFKAWEIETGSRDVIVAIIDGGIDYNHEDLKDNVWINEAELNGTEGVDDDNNGYIDDVYGWNFIRESNLVYPHEHGTHVAGTVSAVNNNGIGVCGVAGGSGNQDGVRLMSCQIFDVVEGNGNVDYAKAIVYAANNRAVIASCSWGWNIPGLKEQSVEDAINYFIAEAGNYEGSPMKGGICFFATGNLGTEGAFYPAAYPNVVAVGAMCADFKIASYTNYGPYVDLTAPGGDGDFDQRLAVLSTKPHNTYGYFDGTSMATPHVSGVAALALSKFGGKGYTCEQLKKRILSSVHDLYKYNTDPYWKGKFGIGYLDAELALREDHKKAPAQIREFKLLASQQAIGVEWIIPEDEDDQQVEKHLIYYSEKPFTAQSDLSTLSVKETDTRFTATGTTLLEEVENLKSATTYWVAIQAIDRWGNKSVLSPVQSTVTNNGPIVTLDKEYGLNLNVNVNDTYVVSDVLTASNVGEGLLKWQAELRRKNPEEYPMMQYPAAAAQSSPVPFSGNIHTQARETREIVQADFMKEDFPKYLFYYDNYMYDIGEKDDPSRTNSMAQYFLLNQEDYPEGFNLTHISAEFVNPFGKTIVQVYGDASSVSEAPLLLSDTLETVDYTKDVALSHQLHFESGEGFWLVIHIGPKNDRAFGIGEEKAQGFTAWSLYSQDMGKTWSTLQEVLKNSNISSIASKAVYTIKAVSKYPNLLDYISVDPVQGNTSPGESSAITLSTREMDIPDGYYDFDLYFRSNETGHEQRILPVSLNVSGHKPLLHTARVVNFGDLFIGKSKTIDVEVVNTGYGDFLGEWGSPYQITSSDPNFEVPSWDAPQLAARAKTYLPITYKPGSVGTHTATITLTDQHNITHTFIVRGIADEPAHISYTPGHIDAGELIYGEAAKTFQVNIKNEGNYPLEYLFPQFSSDTLTGLTQTSHKFGYSYISNLQDPNEYTYQWEELTNATDLSKFFNDDVRLSGAIELGFDFPFYGKNYSKIYISNYGALSVTGEGFDLMMCRQALSSSPLCISGMGLITALGMPLQFDKDSKLLYGKQNGRFIVSYENAMLETWNGTCRVSFRIALAENGDIAMYFKDYDVTTFNRFGEDIFVGCSDIEVADPFVITDMEQILNTGSTTHMLFGNEKAIYIAAPGSNMIRSIDSPSGIVAAQETHTVNLTVAADSTMYAGPLKNILTLLSTDPDKSTSYITLSATISGDRYQPIVKLEPEMLDLGTQFRTTVLKRAISIKNAGQKAVNITAVSLENNRVSLSTPALPYELKPGTSLDAIISVPSDQSGTITDVLHVTAENGQNLSASIRATITGNPAIRLNPSVINETLASGTSKGMVQEITNDGDETLIYTLNHHPYYHATHTTEGTGEVADYSYASSLNNDQVEFEWEDITQTGEHIRMDYLAIHDYVKLPLPEKYIFYGQEFDTLYIYGNGFMTFQYYTDGNHPMPNPPVKVPAAENTFINYIAPFWGMHAPDESSTSGIYTEVRDDRVIVSFMEYSNVMNHGINFQAILYKNGKIKFQYKLDEDALLASLFGFSGIENGNHTLGIKLPARYVGDQLATELYPVKTFTLQPQQRKQIPMILSAEGLLAGQYNADITLTTNVPGQEETILPLSLSVTGNAQPVFPGKIDFGAILVGSYLDNQMTQKFEVSNTGTAAFRITDFYLKHSEAFCSVSHLSNNGGGDLPMPGPVAPANYYGSPIEVGKKAEEFALTFFMPFFTPQEVRDTLVFITDLPHSIIEVPVTAQAVNPPQLDITQRDMAFYATVDTARFDSVFTIANTLGEYKLDYTIGIESNSTAITSPLSASAKPNSGKPIPVKAIPAKALKMLPAPATRAGEDGNPFPDREFLREMRYESVGDPVGYTGTGDELLPFEAIIVYQAPADGFNISAVECLATISGIESGKITALIQVGEYYSQAQTIGQGSLRITDKGQEFRLIPLERPVFINPNETFYVRLQFPAGVPHPLGLITMTDKDAFERYYVYVDNQWIDMINFAAMQGNIGPVVRCLEYQAGTPWITISDPNQGSIAQGSEGRLTVHVNAKTARYIKGNQATIRITGNLNPEEIKHTFKVSLDKNQGPEITRLTEEINLSENEMQEVEFQVTDHEGDDFSISLEDENQIASQRLEQNDLTVLLHPAFGQAGNQHFTIVATDAYDNQTRMEVEYYVQKKNRAPIVIAKPEAIKTNLGNVIEPIDLSLVFNDPDGDPLHYTLSSTDENVALGFAKDGWLEFTQKAQGETEIFIKATDPEGLADSTSIDLELINPKTQVSGDQITVYPNPVVYLLKISCPEHIEGESLLRLYNMGGTLVYSEKTVLGSGISKTLDMASFPSGVYILEIECNGEKMSTKIVKQ